MADNDPIKDYNEFSLKLDRLQEKMEMYIGGDDPVTDLHDCSNDLSDAGSRREEYEHAKYAEKIRKGMNSNRKTQYDTWETINKKTTNSVMGIIILFFVISAIIRVGGLIEEFSNDISNVSNYYSEEYIEYEALEQSQFELYVDNIVTRILTTKENETYVEVYNSNLESYENLKLETIFYDAYGEIIQRELKYVDILLGDNYHYFKLLNVPMEYASCEINILDDDGDYTDIKKDDFIVEFKSESMGYTGETIVLTNNCYEKVYQLEFVIVYFYNDGLVDIKKCNFYDLDFGDIEEKRIYSYGVENEDIQNMRITVNDLY